MPPVQEPTFVSAIIALSAYQSAAGMICLLECPDYLVVPKVPFEHVGIAVYIEATDGLGDWLYEVRLVHAETEVPIAPPVGLNLKFEDPTKMAKALLRISPLKVLQPGSYRLQACHKDDVRNLRRIDVHVAPQS